MPKTFVGDGICPPCRVAIVVSRYNETITTKLLEGAIATFQSSGIDDADLDVAWVPGAWEIPLIVQRFARSQRYAAIVALGAVIRGETTHDEHINRQVSHNLGKIALDADMPISFGILTCNTLEQAIHRSGGQVGNKGVECANSALEMIKLGAKLG